MDKRQQKLERRIEQLSLLSSWAAVGLLGLCVAGVGLLWIYAASQGLYPHPRAVARNPLWAGNTFLADAVYHLAFLPLGAFSAAVFSALLKPNVRALIAISLSVVCFFIVVVHMGIIDD